MATKVKAVIVLFALFGTSGCGSSEQELPGGSSSNTNSVYGPTPAVIDYSVVKAYPHDTTAFTEGLLFHKGKLYESTGSPTELLQTKSLIGVVDLNTGKLDVRSELDRNKYFGEGIVILNDKVY